MLMSVVCCHLTSIIGRRQLSICQLGGCRKPKNWKWYNLLAPIFYSICSTSVLFNMNRDGRKDPW